MNPIHEHATCRACGFEARSGQVRSDAEAHADRTGHTVAYKITLAEEIEP